MKCSIIIVTWNGLDWLRAFLPSVLATDHAHFEVIIADNASTDGTAEWVGEHFPEARVVRLDRNYGYCGGNNRAAAAASGELLVFLNNDVQVEPGWLKPLAKAFEDDPTLGAAQPKILSFRQPDTFEYAGAAGGMMDRFGYPFCRGRVFGLCETDRGQYDTPSDIFWASGAALAIRKRLFTETGGFDEDFEFHMEEIDLCWNLIRRGHRIGAVPQSKVFHVGGGSLDQNAPRKLRYNVRNNLAMLWKHLPAQRLPVVFSARLALDAVALLREASRLRFGHARAIAEGYGGFLRGLRATHRKRRKLASEGVPTSEKGLSRLVLPWQHFVLGRKTCSELPPQRQPV